MIPLPTLSQAKVIAAVLLVVGAFFAGMHFKQLQVDSDNLEALTEQIKLTKQLQSDLKEVETAYITVAGKLDTNKTETIRYVTKVITKESDAKCVIPVGFVRLYNNSLRGETTVPSITDGDATNLALSSTASIVAENNFICNREIEKLKALQQAIKKYEEKFNGN